MYQLLLYHTNHFHKFSQNSHCKLKQYVIYYTYIYISSTFIKIGKYSHFYSIELKMIGKKSTFIQFNPSDSAAISLTVHNYFLTVIELQKKSAVIIESKIVYVYEVLQ